MAAKEKKKSAEIFDFPFLARCLETGNSGEIDVYIGGRTRHLSFKTRQQRLATQKLHVQKSPPLMGTLAIWERNFPNLAAMASSDEDGFAVFEETIMSSLDVNLLAVLLFVGAIDDNDSRLTQEEVDTWLDSARSEQSQRALAYLHAAICLVNVGATMPPKDEDAGNTDDKSANPI